MTNTEPTAAVRWAAWIGIAALVPYAAIKAYWAGGGRAGLPAGFDLADEFRRNGAPEPIIWLEQHGIDFTAALAVVGAVLLMALVRPWGMRVPRWILLAPAWAGAALFVPYGSLTAVIALSGRNDNETPAPTGWLTVAAVIAFYGVGSTLGLCARSYQRRSNMQRTLRRTHTARGCEEQRTRPAEQAAAASEDEYARCWPPASISGPCPGTSSCSAAWTVTGGR